MTPRTVSPTPSSSATAPLVVSTTIGSILVRRDRDHMPLGRVLAERRRQVDAVRERRSQAERVHERVHLGRVRPRAQEIAGVLVVGLVGVEREQEALVAGRTPPADPRRASPPRRPAGTTCLSRVNRGVELAGAEVERPHPVAVGRLGWQVVQQVEVVAERRERLRLHAAGQRRTGPARPFGSTTHDRVWHDRDRRRLARRHVGQRHQRPPRARSTRGCQTPLDLGPEQRPPGRPGDLHRGPVPAARLLATRTRSTLATPARDRTTIRPRFGVDQREPGRGAHQQQVTRARSPLSSVRASARRSTSGQARRSGWPPARTPARRSSVTTSHVDAIRRTGSRFPDF